MRPAVNYEKERRRTTVGIVASAIILALALSIGLAGLFFFLDAVGGAVRAQRNEQWFDPWEEGTQKQNSFKCWEMTGLSEEFAVDFKETYHYYFAFDSSWNPIIVKMKGELGEEYEPYVDAVYVEGMERPEPFMLRGVAAAVEDDIREFAIEGLNALFGGEVISDDTFDEFMGVCFLDTTKKPMGYGDFSAGAGFGMFGVVFCVVGIICLTVNIKRRRNIGLAQQRERESMSQAAAWRNAGYYEDGGYRDSGYSDGWGSRDGGAFGSEGKGQSAPGYREFGRGEANVTGEGYPGGDEAVNEFGYAGSADKGYVNGSGVRLVPVRKSNMFLGILGAVGGSLIGVGLWLLISFAGFIAGFAGFVMLRCTLKGYEKLSGRLDKKGAVISLVIAGAMVFFANQLEYVIALYRAFMEWDASLDTIRYVIVNFGGLMSETESWGGFYMNLVLGYGLSIWSSYRVILGILSYKEP